MSRVEELKVFAQQQEIVARGNLTRIREDIEKKKITCNGVKDRYKVIQTEGECNNENQQRQDFTTNLNDILEFYNEQLSNIDDSAGRLSSILPFDFNNVELDDNISIEEYKSKISNCYGSVILKFNQASRAIIQFCKVLVDIADQNRTEEYGLSVKVYVMVNILVKFLLPLQAISKVLNECLEQVKLRDDIPKNPNDDDRREEACEQLKNHAKRLIKKDSKIKASFSQLLDAIVDGFGLSEAFRDAFYGFMKDYYELNRAHGIVHLELCAYKMHEKSKISGAQISKYLDDVNNLKGKLQNSFNGAIGQISDILRS